MFLRTEKKRKRKSTIFPELLKERNETKEEKEGIICSCEQRKREREKVPFFPNF